MKWIKILDQIPKKEQTVRARVSNKNICVLNNNDKLFAFTSKCPHAGADLSNGWCKDEHWVCPVHRYKYNLVNGRGADGQGDYLKIYPLQARNDGVYIGLKKSWWNFFSLINGLIAY